MHLEHLEHRAEACKTFDSRRRGRVSDTVAHYLNTKHPISVRLAGGVVAAQFLRQEVDEVVDDNDADDVCIPMPI